MIVSGKDKTQITILQKMPTFILVQNKRETKLSIAKPNIRRLDCTIKIAQILCELRRE